MCHILALFAYSSAAAILSFVGIDAAEGAIDAGISAAADGEDKWGIATASLGGAIFGRIGAGAVGSILKWFRGGKNAAAKVVPLRDAKGRFTSNAGGHTADAARGIAAHKNYKNALGGNYKFEFELPSGRRADAVDFENRIVRELKPDNPRAIQSGQRQVERYRQELEREFGGEWSSIVDTYKP